MEIDLIVAKSVSRFARNTVDSLTPIRKLKEHGTECYFEKEGIYTFDGKGEVPQYYVENSHPAIIEPDEWGHVQAELTRRKSLGRAYSGKSIFSAKLVCEECGSFFGSKVWHSTDQYRRHIWQCNGKFSNAERCHTPTLDTETIQRLFIQAYNQLMSDRKQTIADCELARRCLTDFAALDAEIERSLQKCRSLPKWSRRRSGKTHPPHSPRKPTSKSTKPSPSGTKKPLRTGAVAERTHCQNPAGQENCIVHSHSFKKLPGPMTDWDDTIWAVIIVYKGGEFLFAFKSREPNTIL